MNSEMYIQSGPFDIRKPEEKSWLGKQIAELMAAGIKWKLDYERNEKRMVNLWREESGRMTCHKTRREIIKAEKSSHIIGVGARARRMSYE